MILSPLAQSQSFDVDTVLSPYVYVFIVAYLISFIFTPIMRRVAEYYGVIDSPDLLRKMHSRPVARIGLRALARGRASVVPGWLNAITAWSNRLMPRAVQRKVAFQLMRND